VKGFNDVRFAVKFMNDEERKAVVRLCMGRIFRIMSGDRLAQENDRKDFDDARELITMIYEERPWKTEPLPRSHAEVCKAERERQHRND